MGIYLGCYALNSARLWSIDESTAFVEGCDVEDLGGILIETGNYVKPEAEEGF